MFSKCYACLELAKLKLRRVFEVVEMVGLVLLLVARKCGSLSKTQTGM